MFLPAGPYSMLAVPNGARVREAIATTTMIVDQTTGSATMFTLTGSVLVQALWGQVTTVISANHTAGFVELYDQTASPDVTAAAGVTLSALTVGTMVYKAGLASAILTLVDNAVAVIKEPTTLETFEFSPFAITKKNGAVTIMRYTYTTTDHPSTGAIQWHALWTPLSSDGALA